MFGTMETSVDILMQHFDKLAKTGEMFDAKE